MIPFHVVGAAPVSISVPTLLIEALIFFGVVWMMERLVFNPIRQAWRERDESVRAGLEAAEASRHEAQDARAEVQRILLAARREAQHAIDDATAAGDKVRAQHVEEATAEFQRLLGEARIQIQAEEAQAAAQLRDRVIDLALTAAAQITGRSYDSPDVRQLAAAVVEHEGWA